MNYEIPRLVKIQDDIALLIEMVFLLRVSNLTIFSQDGYCS